MKTKQTIAESLSTYLNHSKMATMNQLKSLLKTNSRMTVFRKLEKTGYVSSCSHSGKYYALKRNARFNKHGIWRHDSVLFSKHGTLKNTLKVLIENSAEGFTAAKLNKILKLKGANELGKPKLSGIRRVAMFQCKSILMVCFNAGMDQDLPVWRPTVLMLTRLSTDDTLTDRNNLCLFIWRGITQYRRSWGVFRKFVESHGMCVPYNMHFLYDKKNR